MASQGLTPEALEGVAAQLDSKPAHEACPHYTSSPAGMAWLVDAAVEITWKVARSYQAGFKSEIFNITNQEAQLNTSATAWCGSDAGAGCSAAIANFGKATARGQYQQPRRYRFSLILRF